jgi:hypothetical protein
MRKWLAAPPAPSMAAPAQVPSQPSDPRQRFLARVLEASFERGWRTADEFLEAFPPAVLLDALERAPGLRLQLLVECAQIPRKIAARRSAAAAREDLELALEEGLTTAATLLATIPLEARVQHLEAARLWRFAVEGDWLDRAPESREAQQSAVDRVTTIVRLALGERLITLHELAAGLTPEQIATRLPVSVLRAVFVYAMKCAAERAPTDSERLLGIVQLESLVADLPVAHVWQTVVNERIAASLGLPQLPAARARTTLPGVTPAPPPAAALPAPARPNAPSVRPTASVRPVAAVTPLPAPVPPASLPRPTPPPPRPAPRAAPRAVRPPDLTPVEEPSFQTLDDAEIELSDDEPDFATIPGAVPPGRVPGAMRGPAAVEAGRRRAVAEKLRRIGRLPANHEYLSLAILRSISVMYDEIKSRRGKAARAACVRECFDNESHLRTAMLALIELLDPPAVVRLERSDLDELIDALLSIERQIWQRAGGGRRPSTDTATRRVVHVKPQTPPPALPLTRVTKPGWRH